jgi:hypothetical protein
MNQAINLLDFYTLMRLEPFKVAAEIFRPARPNEQTDARVELKLSPLQPSVPNDLPPGVCVMQARLHVLGIPPGEPETQRLFEVDIAFNALYQPNTDARGKPLAELSFQTFCDAHGSLTRQLLPMLERRASALLAELGLHHIRLPMDLSQPKADVEAHRVSVAYH